MTRLRAMARACLGVALVVFALVGAACAGAVGPGVGTLRYLNRNPVWAVNDRNHVAEPPGFHPEFLLLDGFDDAFYRRITLPLEMREPHRAKNVNSLGEVPDSSWFENRLGRGRLTAAAVARGPGIAGGPDVANPLVVVSGKIGGASAGFIVEDKSGDRFIVKFDNPSWPILETASDVITQRLLWALGYHVSDNQVVTFRRDQLQLSPTATVRDQHGYKRKMTERDIETNLARAHRDRGGEYRALFSRFIEGTLLGGIYQEGTRPGDGNDTIAHEYRRELRGLRLICAWLQHTDMKEGNTLAVWIEDPRQPGVHYVKHFLIDFGNTLGAFAVLGKRPADGHVETLDWDYFVSAITFGLWKRPWEGVRHSGYEGVGLFNVEHFDPAGFSPHGSYVPFLLADPYDEFWAAKQMMLLTAAHIAAAVEQGKLRDQRAADELQRVLIGRQRKAARYAFRRVNPLDRFALTGDGAVVQLCFADLLLAYGLDDVDALSSRYSARAYAADGRVLGEARQLTRRAGGSLCSVGLPLARTADQYTIIRLDTWRGSRQLRPVEVHVARSSASRMIRIIGIHRR